MAATIKFDDGKQVELSEETTKKLRAELVKPEHVWKHGDIGGLDDCERLFIEVNGKLEIFSEHNKPFEVSDRYLGITTIQEWVEYFDYKFLGNIFDGTYKP